MNSFLAPTGALTTLVTTCHHLQHLAQLALHEHEDQDEQVADDDPQVRGGQAAGEEAEEAREGGEGRRHQGEKQETVVKRKKMPKIISRYRKKTGKEIGYYPEKYLFSYETPLFSFVWIVGNGNQEVSIAFL